MSVRNYLNRDQQATPKQMVGIAGFELYSTLRESTTLKASVPVHFVEDGSPKSEHIIREPEMVAIQGSVGDIFVRENEFAKKFNRTANTAGRITSLLPSRTQTQLQKISSLQNDVSDELDAIDDIISRGEQAASLFGYKAGGKPLGEQFLDAVESAYYGDQLVSINTEFRKYENMAVVNFTHERDNQSGEIMFTIDFQKFNSTTLELVQIAAAPRPAESLGGSTQKTTDKGVQRGEEVPTSLLNEARGLLFND